MRTGVIIIKVEGGGGALMLIYLKEVCKVLHTDEVRKLGQAVQRRHQQRKPLLCICCCQFEPCTTIAHA